MAERALALEHAVVGGVTHQRMLEDVGRVGRFALMEHQFGAHQIGQRRVERGRRHGAEHLGHEPVAELAADHRANLCDFLGLAKRVEACHQRVLQAGRNHQLRQRPAELVAGRRAVQQARLHHSLGQLFNEQRNAVRLADDLGDYVFRERLAYCDRTHQRHGLLLRQPVQAEAGQLRRVAPRGCVLRAARHQQHYARVANSLGNLPNQLFAGRIDPVRVFDQEEHRLLLGQALQQIDQGLERVGPFFLRRGTAKHGAAAIGQAHQPKQATDGGFRQRAGQLLELVRPALGRIGRCHTRSALQMLHDRVQRAVAEVG